MSVDATWAAAALAGGVAIAAGLADRAQRRRSNLDRGGLADWRTVQMAAMLLLIIALGLGLA